MLRNIEMRRKVWLKGKKILRKEEMRERKMCVREKMLMNKEMRRKVCVRGKKILGMQK